MLQHLDQWRYPSPQDQLRFLDQLGQRSKTASTRISTWRNDGRLSPLTLYCYLKSAFGQPNGPMTLFRNRSTDNLFHWDYILVHEESFLHIIATQRRLEFILRANYEVTDADWNELVQHLMARFLKEKKAISTQQRHLERWTVFVNPFRRLQLIMNQLQDQLAAFDFLPVDEPTEGSPARPDVEAYLTARQAQLNETIKAATVGYTMRVLAPIMGETFVNTIITLLAKKQIRDDRHTMQSVIRNNIDIRIKTFSINCDGFARPIDQSAEPVKQFLRLMGRRNDLLHGNIDPKSLAIEDVFFDHDTIPLFQHDTPAFSRHVQALLQHIDPRSAKSDYEIVKSFITFVLSHLEPQSKDMAEHFLNTSFPGFRPATRRFGMLFGENIVESFVGPSQPEKDQPDIPQ